MPCPGEAPVNAEWLAAGDALRIGDEPELTIEDGHDAEVLVFDLD